MVFSQSGCFVDGVRSNHSLTHWKFSPILKGAERPPVCLKMKEWIVKDERL